MKFIIKISFLSLVLITGLALIAGAQPPAPPATPIDGGLSLLLAAGGAYGLKKLIKNRT
ncbi:MAG: hypothetical protein ABJ004_00450 [Cyclobacteriaceae bacterium]